jgi:hypothetical protein
MKTPNHIITTILLALGFLAPSSIPNSFGVVPAPDGGYPGFNTAEGTNALKGLTTGVANTANGWFSLFSNADGSFNTALGAGTLLFNVGNQSTGDGTENTAIGAAALLNNTTGQGNTATGAAALSGNTEGVGETAVGDRALSANTTGDFNTAIGSAALQANTQGESNTAIGTAALLLNQTGSRNTAAGVQALFLNTAGDNTAFGYKALDSNTTGFFNTAIGEEALQADTDGGGNTALGYFALHNKTTGGGNIAIGIGAGVNLGAGNNNIYIGNVGANSDSNTTRIGIAKTTQRTFIDGISGVPVTGTAVVVDSNGQLGVAPSSKRFKKEIQPMDNVSKSILALKPVTFQYKSDDKNTPQFGLIAEEVAAANPNLVVRDENGEIYTVRYDAVNAMLLNEFLKEHKKVEDQQATIAELKSTVRQQQKGMEVLTAQLKEQVAQIQKVSARVEMSKPAPQVAASRN